MRFVYFAFVRVKVNLRLLPLIFASFLVLIIYLLEHKRASTIALIILEHSLNRSHIKRSHKPMYKLIQKMQQRETNFGISHR